MRQSLCALLSLALLVVLPRASSATDLASMQPPEIEALQKRLADAGCYKGSIDGQASPATAEAVKACPDQEPVLRIETGMHIATIWRIGVDAACRFLATGSEDKTVRLWSLPEGRLVRTVRLPIGPGEGGKVRAVALSPDGRTLAAGGWDAGWEKGQNHGLYVVDLASGEVRRFGFFEDVIKHIAFSADGARIGLGLGGSTGIRVLDRETGRELMADREYGSDVYGLDFVPDGTLVTTSYDGFLRRYRPDFKLDAKVKAPDGMHPYGVAVDPAGRRAAVGYLDNTAVSILDGKTLKPLAKGNTADVKNGFLNSVALTADGRQVVAGGGADEQFGGTWKRFVRSFDQGGKRNGADIAAANNTIMDLKPCGASIAFAAQDPRFGLLGADGVAHTLQSPVTADMRDKMGDAFTLSADAATVRFGLGVHGERPVAFNLAAGTLADTPTVSADLHQATIKGLPVTDWLNKTAPKLKGASINLDPYEISRSLAIRPDRTGFVLGTDFHLRAFDAAGNERWKQPVPGAAWGTDVSGGGQIVVAAYGDGTIRWHRWSDGQELLAFFVNAQDKRWVAWTPSGYYMASPGAEDMIGWHLNRGWEQEADFFPASRFRDRFNRPDVVRLVLKTLDEGEALKQADALAGKRHEDVKPLIERLPPVITIVSPADGTSTTPGTVEVRYSVRLPSGGTVDHVEAFVDGARIEARGLARVDATSAASANGNAGSVTLPMPAHDAVVSLIAYADGKASDAARVTLKGTAPAYQAVGADELKPSLYALLVGVTHYADASLDLGYAADDARAVAEVLKAQEGKLYRHVEVKVLTDKEATVGGIRDGLDWLSRQTTSHDLVVVFEAGHGLQDKKGRFFFGTTEANPQRLQGTAFSNEEMEETLSSLPGKKMLFMDACHAGSALSGGERGLERIDMSAAISDFAQAESGMVVYGASTGKELSLERSEWGHGAFTKALIEGLGGKADLTHKGVVTTATLDFFLAERVKELTSGAQHPVMTRPKTVPDFPIAAIESQAEVSRVTKTAEPVTTSNPAIAIPPIDPKSIPLRNLEPRKVKTWIVRPDGTMIPHQ